MSKISTKYMPNPNYISKYLSIDALKYYKCVSIDKCSMLGHGTICCLTEKSNTLGLMPVISLQFEHFITILKAQTLSVFKGLVTRMSQTM